MKRRGSIPWSATIEEIGERLIALLLVVEAISVVLLWTLNSYTSQGQTAFALYLGVDFISFAMMSYLYRNLENEEPISRLLVIAGCLFIAACFFVGFALPS
ncbi:MAG TPA: hypothetical protein VLU99_03165 [Nitrososphaerales archaeon]|nr:hypothetical protein [Nitrososphaerales archaeon]HUK74768.1 hypothetical protein [Nitrososphaerales archaeon]